MNLEAFASEMLGIFREHRLDRRTQAPIDALTIDQAYDVQDRVIAARVAGGESVAGWKVGCTSPAIREQFGLTEPMAGRIMHPHVHADRATLNAADFVGPAVEPEFVLHIGPDLELEAVSAGIEVHNYRFFHGEPTAQELIASNGIHAAVVVGPARFEPEGDMRGELVEVVVNGDVRARAMSSDILGGPLDSLAWLRGHLASRGLQLRPGDVVYPGSATPLVRLEPGDVVESRIGRYGTCRATFR